MSDEQLFDPNTVVSQVLPHLEAFSPDRAKEEAYWTPERMAAAEPFALQSDRAPPAETDPSVLESFRQPEAEVREQQSRPGDRETEGMAALAVPYQTALVAGPASFPYSAVGKLFARVNGVDQFGTAFVVGERAIVTAGHCVFSDVARNWVEKLAFAPRYQNTPPLGLWYATSVHTLAGWAAQPPNARLFDLGGVILDRPVAQATGTIGWVANIPPAQGPFHSVGYPRQWLSPNFPFDGKLMWWCTGSQLQSSGYLRMANNLTEGASGGPWLIKRNGNIYVNGLNSFRLSNEPEVLASPYFGQGLVNLIGRISP